MGRGWDKITTTIRQQDLFGIPVQLTFRGEKAFNTIAGGCVSILIVILLIAYFCFGLI